MSSNSPLLQLLPLRDLTLRNRVVMAPMTRARASEDRVPTPLIAEHYAQRSSAGLIVTEATTVGPGANGWTCTPGIYTDAMAAGWRPVVDAVHARGGLIFLQLWHAGRAAHSSFLDGKLPVAPSALRIETDQVHTRQGKQPYETPRPLETDEVPGVVAEFRDAAARAWQAGFDGVELHGANGYLIDEFLQSKTNRRADRYGGSVENRFRFLREIVEAIVGVMPAQRLAVRLSPNGVYNDMGSPDFRETFTYAAEQLDAYGLSYLHVVDGLGFGFHQLGEAMTLAEFRRVFHGPLMGNCAYDQASAEAALARGDADCISFGRPYITNPDLVERFAHDWPLAPPADMKAWYTGGPKGYVDFEPYRAEREAVGA